MKQEQAEIVAIQALGWICAEDDLASVFMGATGASADDLRNRADDPAFLGSVLEFLLMDDGNVMAFCDAHGLPYQTPMVALNALPGLGQVHWR